MNCGEWHGTVDQCCLAHALSLFAIHSAAKHRLPWMSYGCAQGRRIYEIFTNRTLIPVQMLCELPNLRHLTVAACQHLGRRCFLDVESAESIAARRILPAIPPAVSQLQLLRSLGLPSHEAVMTLPPELFMLSR